LGEREIRAFHEGAGRATNRPLGGRIIVSGERIIMEIGKLEGDGP
jgi:hypothetical protein